MPQSATADVNAAVLFYRSKLYAAYERRDWIEFITCVRVIDGILPQSLKFKWGFESDRESRYVRCPSEECGKDIPYHPDAVLRDYHYYCMNPALTGDQYSEYVECTCKRRVYLDNEDVVIHTSAVNFYSKETVLLQPPSITPPAPEDDYLNWSIKMLPIVEDRFRQWREMVSTSSGVSGVEGGGEDADEEDVVA